MSASQDLQYDERTCNSFHEIKQWEEELRHSAGRTPRLWVFRGQGDSRWNLETVLDRARNRFGVNAEDLPLLEEGLIREFIRHVGNTGAEVRLPPRNSLLEWLALMRHYGGPTRLLDWTYSLHVALYFAVESGEENCALWAIDVKWCNEQSRKVLDDNRAHEAKKKDPYLQSVDTFRAIAARKVPVPLIYRVNPFILNQRLARQKGLFLCPGDIRKPFFENLQLLQKRSRAPARLHKVIIPSRSRPEIMRELFSMNIGSDTLFPGLGGLAQSLNSRLLFKDILIPDWRRKLKKWGPFEGWANTLEPS